MAGKWYFQLMGEVIGPLTATELRERAASGQIQRDTLVRKEDGDWAHADRVRGLFTSPTPGQRTTPSMPNTENSANAAVPDPAPTTDVTASSVGARRRTLVWALGGVGTVATASLLVLAASILISGDSTVTSDGSANSNETAAASDDLASRRARSSETAGAILNSCLGESDILAFGFLPGFAFFSNGQRTDPVLADRFSDMCQEIKAEIENKEWGPDYRRSVEAAVSRLRSVDPKMEYLELQLDTRVDFQRLRQDYGPPEETVQEWTPIVQRSFLQAPVELTWRRWGWLSVGAGKESGDVRAVRIDCGAISEHSH